MPRSFAGITRCSSMARPLAKGSGSGAGGASRRAAVNSIGSSTSSKRIATPSRLRLAFGASVAAPPPILRTLNVNTSFLLGAYATDADVVPVARVVERTEADLAPGERLVGRRHDRRRHVVEVDRDVAVL